MPTQDSAAGPQLPADGFASLQGQDQVIGALRNALGRNRLPHALAFHGPRGVGKATCAGQLARALNCRREGPLDACGHCVSCQKIRRGYHPDVLWLAPEARALKIAQVRQVIEAVVYRPHEGERRVIVIDDAHTLNPASQNALLKTLEEPPPSSHLILVTPAFRSLLPTVRSRCQALRFRPLAASVVRRQLKSHGLDSGEVNLRAALAPGSLGDAIDLELDQYRRLRTAVAAALRAAQHGGRELVAAAEMLIGSAKEERPIDAAAQALRAGRAVLRDLLILCTGSGDDLLLNIDRATEWRDWADRLTPIGLTTALGAAEHGLTRLSTGIQPNAKLSLERSLVEIGESLILGCQPSA